MIDILLILILSFAPMLLYAGLLWWLDRYEKEPLALLAAAFLWGAIPSIILALILEVALDVPVMAFSRSALMYDLLGASVVAPLVEEGVKALALLALLLFLRREIDSPMDGLIYGGIVGFGFAAVENVFYLFGAYTAGGMGVTMALALLRAGLFGLNHAMYTSFAGLGIALSLEVRKWWLKVLLVIAGFGSAVASHAIHNAFATFLGYETSGALLVAGIVDWAGVLVLLLVALWAFILERQRIRRYALALVRAEKLPKSEVLVLNSSLFRRLERGKALLALDVRRWLRLGRYYRHVSEAAFAWHRWQAGDARAEEHLRKIEEKAAQVREDLALDDDLEAG